MKPPLQGPFARERALQEGTLAWQTGNLQHAVECLEAVLEASPGAVEALFPLARALSECGEVERALKLLEEAARTPAEEAAARLYRALTLYDHGDPAQASVEAKPLVGENALAEGLLLLVDLGEGKVEPRSFPTHSLWLPDVAGRLLAILEAELYAGDPGAGDRLHHGLYYPTPAAGADGDEPQVGPLPASFPSAQAWRHCLEQRFELKRFADVIKLHEQADAQAGWADLYTDLQHGFALLAEGRAGKASALFKKLVAANPRDADAHFLHGLALTRNGHHREAAWAYVRAARLSDVDVHHVLELLLAPR